MGEQMAKPEYKIKIRDAAKVEKLQEESYQIPILQTREELNEFLIQNTAYPYCSKRGTIFFRRIKTQDEGVDLFEKIINEDAIEILGLKTEEDCKLLREKIKEEVNKRKEHKAIKYWSEEERPREMLMKYGAENLSPVKLLAIVLRTGDSADGVSAEELAKKLLNRFGSFKSLDTASIPELSTIRGIGMAKAVQIKAALEIGKRFMREETAQKKRIRTAEDVFKFYAPYLKNLKEEVFKIMLLDGMNKFMKDITISKGSLTASIVHPREVIKEVTKESAAAVIFVHNHPRGEPKPSEEDIETTNRLVQACDLVGIRVLDHIIIGGDGYMSFVDKGLMTEG
jgi:DNA repair protein RadC